MRRIPGIVPPGKIGLLVLAAALIPVAAKHAKPLFRSVGRGLRNVGDALEKLVADDAQPEPAAAESPLDDQPTPPEKKKSKPKAKKSD